MKRKTALSEEAQILAANGIEVIANDGEQKPDYQKVRFAGQRDRGPFAVGIALEHGLKVMELRRLWLIVNGEMTGPFWELTFGERNHERQPEPK